MRLYRYKQLRDAGIPWSRKHIWVLEGEGKFPRSFKLGPNTQVWDADEVDAWVKARADERRPVPEAA